MLSSGTGADYICKQYLCKPKRRRNNQRMKCRFLASFLLGFLFVTNALGGQSPRVVLGLERKEKKPEVSSTGLFVRKELSDRIGAVHLRRRGLGESNLMAQKEPRKEDDALKKFPASLLIQMNDQKAHMSNILEPKAKKGINFVVPRSKFCDRSPKCFCFQYSNAKVADGGRLKNPSRPTERQMTEELLEKDEAQSLGMAANEIVNLIHKDYKGTPSGNPPINNLEPRN